MRLLGKVLLLAALAMLSTTTTACAAFSQGDSPGPALVAKADQMAGVLLVYQASKHEDIDKQLALTQALTILGVDMQAVEATVPSATGLALATRICDENADLQPYHDLIAKLWTMAVYGSSPPASGAGAGPPPDSTTTASPMSALGVRCVT